MNAAVRRSDIIFAEAEEKKRRTKTEGVAAEEAILTGGSSGSAGPAAAPQIAPASRKRRPDVDIEEIDSSAGDAASSPSVVVETTGTKRQAEKSVADIDPQSGDRADVAALMFAALAEVGGSLAAGEVRCQLGDSRVFAASMEVGDCSPPR